MSSRNKDSKSLSFGEAGDIADRLEQFIFQQQSKKLKQDYTISLARVAKPEDLSVQEAIVQLKNPEISTRTEREEAELYLTETANNWLAGNKYSDTIHMNTRRRVRAASGVLLHNGFSEVDGFETKDLLRFQTVDVRKPSLLNLLVDNARMYFSQEPDVEKRAEANLRGAESARENAQEHKANNRASVIPNMATRNSVRVMR